MRRTGAPLPLRLYSLAANMLGPVAYRGVCRKLAAHGTDSTRWPERRGRATLPRPDGPLLWFHAASIGESVSVLRLITHWAAARPDLNFLLTSGTATSAQVLSSRLPPRTRHQFAPLDTSHAMRQFLTHWQPTAAIFVESELWPQMLSETDQAGIPLALLNARLSDRSARNWQRAARTARCLMGQFRLIHCQDARSEAHLRALGLARARQGPNLKSLSGPLPVDPEARAHLERRIGARPIWCAASTHPGEDEIMLDAHARLLQHDPDALLILVPRHPERGTALETMIAERGLNGARRAIGGQITGQTQVYLADTMGEMGLWYALAPLACLGGSFTPVGGHTPYEPAHAGAAILHGPRYANFAEVYPALDAAGGAAEVTGTDSLAQTLVTLLTSPDRLATMRAAARTFALPQRDALDDIIAALTRALDLTP